MTDEQQYRDARIAIQIASGQTDTFEGGDSLDTLASITTNELAAEIARRSFGSIVCWFEGHDYELDADIATAAYGGALGTPSEIELQELRGRHGPTIKGPAPVGLVMSGETKWVPLMLGILSRSVQDSTEPEIEAELSGERDDETPGQMRITKAPGVTTFSSARVEGSNRPRR